MSAYPTSPEDPTPLAHTSAMSGSGGVPPSARPRRRTLGDLAELHAVGTPLAMVTAYDAPTARHAEAGGADLVLVGDSAAMVVLGHDSTTAVSVDEMALFAAAVRRGAPSTYVVVDMPFLSYQVDDASAILNAGRLVRETGADAVKVEGAGPTIDRVRAISGAGVAVFAHLGLTPQSAGALGGYRAQAKTADRALQLVDDALRLQDAGACLLVLEAIPAAVAEAVTERLEIPTIGIGAGARTSGQVLVYHDLLGITPGRLPKFVRRFAEVGEAATAGIADYVRAVHECSFPTADHTYAMPPAELAAFAEGLAGLAAPTALRSRN
jgi:3-methyl-2-oxobutanoate hydroxymethyltransferase